MAEAKREGWPVIYMKSRATEMPPELARLAAENEAANRPLWEAQEAAYMAAGDGEAFWKAFSVELKNSARIVLVEWGKPKGYPVNLVASMFEDLIERTNEGQYSFDDLALALAEQEDIDPDFFRDAMRRAYVKGELMFWYGGGTPAEPPDCELGQCGEYTTLDAANKWLEAWGALYRLQPFEPVQRGKKTALQRELIEQTLRDLGYDRDNLPPRAKGKTGVKAEVRTLLVGKPPFEKDTAFDTAWKEAGLKS